MDNASLPIGEDLSAATANTQARNWMRASAPGIAFRCRPAESSPIGSDAHDAQRDARDRRASAAR